MKTINLFTLILISILLVSMSFPLITAQVVEEEIEIFGLELEKVLTLMNAWLSLFLFIVAFIAYRRDGRKRLFYVSLAFLLFAIKSFLISSELFIPEIPYIDPIAVILEFGVLLSFFYGVLKK
jgi:hypothetical protein